MWRGLQCCGHVAWIIEEWRFVEERELDTVDLEKARSS